MDYQLVIFWATIVAFVLGYCFSFILIIREAPRSDDAMKQLEIGISKAKAKGY